MNLSNVWDDVQPVLHAKYKSRTTNELSPVILERVINLTTEEGDLIVDPFVGGGTTAYVAEKLNRKWMCADINDCSSARERLVTQADESECRDKLGVGAGNGSGAIVAAPSR